MPERQSAYHCALVIVIGRIDLVAALDAFFRDSGIREEGSCRLRLGFCCCLTVVLGTAGDTYCSVHPLHYNAQINGLENPVEVHPVPLADFPRLMVLNMHGCNGMCRAALSPNRA